MMRNTIYCQTEGEPDMDAITASVNDMVKTMQGYVPGYRLAMPPTFNGNAVVTMVGVEGAGDFLPPYAGNLDIITSAAVSMADAVAEKMCAEEA